MDEELKSKDATPLQMEMQTKRMLVACGAKLDCKLC